ncbi:hypothetical protein [Methyloglobulus sp.]|uniref:hypothetical protein n=1 Tax=Methyloglobulus sp. TaxID=2518622 RepID=UPI0032B74B52
MGHPVDWLLDGTIVFLNVIWLATILSAVVISWFKCAKKSFWDDITYQKHCRFWFRLAMFLYFIGSAVPAVIANDLYGGADNLFYGFGFIHNYLIGYSPLLLMLLLTSLIPAKLQNWLSKK